jgi:hypothetical protein
MVLVKRDKVARKLQDGGVVEIPLELAERKKQEIRGMGLDPDEYLAS